jgi:hypothetical protein
MLCAYVGEVAALTGVMRFLSNVSVFLDRPHRFSIVDRIHFVSDKTQLFVVKAGDTYRVRTTIL